MSCLFCRIVSGEIPASKVYEDDEVFAFNDINPQAPMHVLVVPKRHVATLYDVTDEDRASLGKILALAGRLAREQGANDGFRTIINTGRVGRQDVKHVHVHVLGGPEPLGPMLGR